MMTKIKPSFKEKFTFDERAQECANMIDRYPDKIGLILERSVNASHETPYLHKRKFLAAKDMSLFEFLIVIRNRFHLQETQSIIFFVNDSVLVPNTMILSDIYNQYRDHDGFVYLKYSTENTFG